MVPFLFAAIHPGDGKFTWGGGKFIPISETILQAGGLIRIERVEAVGKTAGISYI